MKSNAFIYRALRYFAANWDRLCLLIGFAGATILSILANLIPGFQGNRELLAAFIYFGGGALIFILLDIQRTLKKEPGEEVEENFTSARPLMIDGIIAESRKRNPEPLTIRFVGMRLTAIQQFLADIAYVARNGQFGRRPIILKIYHVDPEFLAQQRSNREQDTGSPIGQRVKQQAAVLGAIIAEIDVMFDRFENIDVRIASYRNIPLFWAIDISRKALFWGFFTWEKDEQNWVGPENRCIIFRSDRISDRTIMNGILNRIDALDDWSNPSPARLEMKS